MPTYRATIVTFAAGTFTGDVRLASSPNITLSGIKFSRLAAAEYTAGRTVLVDTGDHGDLADVIVYAVVS